MRIETFNAFERMLRNAEEKRKRHAVEYEALDEDECMLCGAHGADKRSLFIDCFYAVDEVVPEALDIRNLELERGRGFYLRICKSCRARLLDKLQVWRNECTARRGLPMDQDGNDGWYDEERNIPVRINGSVTYMTHEEYNAYKAGSEESNE